MNIRVRHWMKIDTNTSFTPIKLQSRPVTMDDVPRLAELMDKAFKETVDYEGETLEQCEDDIRGTLTGKYGPWLDFASFCTTEGAQITSTSLVTLFKEKPLIAFSMTDPAFQGKGLARHLIERSISALSEKGIPHLYLVVTSDNTPAVNLYLRLGFKRIGIAKPGTAPPVEWEIKTEVARARLAAIQSFYKSCGYPGSVSEQDDVVVALVDNAVIGVVRLVKENGVFILRGMYLAEKFQRQGLGSQMLWEFKKLMVARQANTVYCLCGAHLESYYGMLDFKKVDPQENVPQFLVDRMNGYQAQFGSQLIMRRSS